MNAYLILEDGKVYKGTAFGTEKEILCEVVFNTSMIGYPELLTDPSYAAQGVVMTYPIIGSYGLCDEDRESERPWLSAYIVRELNRIDSNFRRDIDLDSFLKQYGVVGIQGIDTRALTRHLREKGTMYGMITQGAEPNLASALEKISSYAEPPVVSIVSRNSKYVLGKGNNTKIALMDFGAKENIARSLVKRDCEVTVYPYNAKAEDIIADKPDGIMLSNGPGDPKACLAIVEEIKKLIASGIPIFGICLGHQLVALASGFDTYKLKYGHRGANHPVKDLKNGKVKITSQNHGYVVDEKTVSPELAEVSHINVNDGSVEGLRYKTGKLFTVQFHPEAAPGPLCTGYLFDEFMSMIEGGNA
ncbi:MAG: carbamoyl phosphate synthase small subunit [Oscillospiraceae bacterium]|jgi:carbamoyl-phosphate synthase small subunit|nr:carbamoyl phosphate synthase small subunit [Oscillospiraceae bacterium]